MVFGQVVIGPPGSGKTTYCDGMVQYLASVGREVAVVNLDPANDELPYDAAADIRDLISLEGAAQQCELGPNGALVYCLEYLEANMDWLEERVASLSGRYVLFDMPGQVELYTTHTCVRAVLQRLGGLGHRLTAVHLVDAHHCADPAKFISVLLVTLSTMVMLEMPQVNLLSKVDLIESYGQLAFSLDFYTDVLDPSRLVPLIEVPERRRDGAATLAAMAPVRPVAPLAALPPLAALSPLAALGTHASHACSADRSSRRWALPGPTRPLRRGTPL